MSFIETYLKKRGISYQTHASGLCYHLQHKGDGPHPKPGQYVKMHYTGKFFDGKVFDSSRQRNEAFIFQLGQGRVIQGWEQGIPLFAVGSIGSLYLSPELGYGDRGAGGVIPPNASLIFDVEVLDVVEESEYEAYMNEKREAYLKLLKKQQKEQLKHEVSEIGRFLKAKDWEFEKTDSGLHYLIKEQGDGAQPQPGQKIAVHYTGKLLNGEVFDSSHSRGEPLSFDFGTQQVIQGWDEGMGLFQEGGKGSLIIPSMLGYGAQAVGPIPANSILWFDVELVKVG